MLLSSKKQDTSYSAQESWENVVRNERVQQNEGIVSVYSEFIWFRVYHTKKGVTCM